MICSRLNLFMSMGPPLAINLKKTYLIFGPILRGQVIYSFSDFDDTNFQYLEVPLYPDPTSLDS